MASNDHGYLGPSVAQILPDLRPLSAEEGCVILTQIAAALKRPIPEAEATDPRMLQFVQEEIDRGVFDKVLN